MNLYIHIPFCERICIYCDFYVTTARRYFDTYTNSVCNEIILYAELLNNSPMEHVYFGGGTPSYLPNKDIQKIVETISANFDVNKRSEITLEANPRNLTDEKLQSLQKIGINRLSIGVQSLRDDELNFLTRNHSAAEAIDCYVRSRKNGFDNISLDLIFGLPGQTLDHWNENLECIISLRPEHISIYNLTVEERTYLSKLVHRGQIEFPDEESQLNMFVTASQKLKNAGYEHYEISNYALPGYRAKHNSDYWKNKKYLGIGPSAHSFDGHKRWWNVRDIHRYCDLIDQKKLPVDNEELLTLQQQCIEAILLGLRTNEGLNIGQLENLTGRKFENQFAAALEKIKTHLLIENGFVRLTTEGFFLYNKICEEMTALL
ncbi:radical SAM family heme chaperone HemW [bacterium]|nr:radical SAM family heme chaperone HemW [bacterium]